MKRKVAVLKRGFITVNRREVLSLAGGVVSAAAIGAALGPSAWAKSADVRAIIDEFAAGQAIVEGQIALTLPEIAENGNTVPIKVKVDSPMSSDDHVVQLKLLAEDNPLPSVATFNFSEMSGSAYVSTRIRLARTQYVVAVAKTNTGAVYLTKKYVKVTIGGCGA